MVDLSAYAFTPVVPASPTSRGERRRQRSAGASSQSHHLSGAAGAAGAATSFLVPSQVILKASHKKDLVDVHDVKSTQSNSDDEQKNRSGDKSTDDKSATSKSKHNNKKNKHLGNRQKRSRPQRFGNYPDVFWRSISMEHMRKHPQFDPLPPQIDTLAKMEDVKNFRQDSWQWDALHRGRCTTSQVSAALGFLEPSAATALSIPKSWQRGAMGAYFRLRDEQEEAMNTLEEMQDFLLANDYYDDDDDDDDDSSDNDDEGNTAGANKQVWSQGGLSDNFPFAAKYLVKMTPEERTRRLRRLASDKRLSTLSTKMSWGNAQEPTSLLTALNYFWKTDPDVRLEEVGMCGAGLFDNSDGSQNSGPQQKPYPKLPALGASPDALIRYPNGTKEVLEVKNHCPFYSTKQGRRNSPEEGFAVKSFPFSEPHLPPLYVPQLMMEMLCVSGRTSTEGDDDGKKQDDTCNSAVMVRQTATTGALVIRLQRNDEWIDEMLYWLQEFQVRFVEPGVPPPTNFFWNDEDTKDRYRAFVEQTKEVAASVEKLDHVPHRSIQRMQGTNPNTTCLFLDK